MTIALLKIKNNFFLSLIILNYVNYLNIFNLEHADNLGNINKTHSKIID